MLNERQKLYIPSNIKVRSEFFNGFGFSELTKTAFITIGVGFVSLLFYMIHQSLSALILSILITCAASITILTKDSTNQSVVDYGAQMVKFARTQKRYNYCYRKEITGLEIIPENHAGN